MSTSFYEDASLVMIPSGYKTSKVYSAKPTDGAGDLTFTRSNDTATRVNSAGLIEKVRTNLVLQSNTFSTTWTLTGLTATSGQSGYDGTTNAWKIEATSSVVRLTQANTTAGLQVFSIYAKAGNVNIIRFQTQLGGTDAFFNLSTGTIGTLDAGVIAAKMTSVGSGWYRCSMAYNETLAEIRVLPQASEFSVSSGDFIYIQNSQLETGDIATDYIATTSAAVSVGPVANVPRLDYLNSSCPRLLLEPQRTNLVLDSESANSSLWTRTSVTVTANQTESPSGYVSADLLDAGTANAAHIVNNFSASFTSGTVYTFSSFAKKGSTPLIQLVGPTGAFGIDVWATYNLDTLEVTKGTSSTASMVDYGNGWYRLILTGTATTTATAPAFFYIFTNDKNVRVPTFTGANETVYVWGAQLEVGAYATSYIPTLGAAVTRGADAASKTGISSLIGQTQGTLFLEANISNLSEARRGVVLYADANNFITLRISSGNDLQFLVFASGAIQANFIIANPQGNVKMALAYKANDFAAYLNGTLVGTDTSGTVPATSAVYLGYDPAGSLQIAAGISQALLFKTRLTNAQLLELTSL